MADPFGIAHLLADLEQRDPAKAADVRASVTRVIDLLSSEPLPKFVLKVLVDARPLFDPDLGAE